MGSSLGSSLGSGDTACSSVPALCRRCRREDDLEGLAKPSEQLVLPLDRQRGWTGDENASDESPAFVYSANLACTRCLWLTKMSSVLAVSIFPKYACLDSHSCCGPHGEQLRTGARFGIDIKT